MKTTRIVFAFLLVLIGAVATEAVMAGGPYHRGGYHGGYRGGHGGGYGGGYWRGGVGVYFGAPFLGFPYYNSGYYAPYYSAYPYYSAPVVIQQQSPVYVEQYSQPAPSVQQSAPAGYWYYCADSRAYYPYVKECPTAWQRVAPQPN